jgi:hypothetical protein
MSLPPSDKFSTYTHTYIYMHTYIFRQLEDADRELAGERDKSSSLLNKLRQLNVIKLRNGLRSKRVNGEPLFANAVVANRSSHEYMDESESGDSHAERGELDISNNSVGHVSALLCVYMHLLLYIRICILCIHTYNCKYVYYVYTHTIVRERDNLLYST